MSRPISLPPTKRRRITPPSQLAPSLPSRPITPLNPDTLRVFSWNINGIQPFLQPPITSYFSKSPAKRKRNASPDLKASPEESHSLANCLRRWAFPSILCLQEVKIAPTDSRTQHAVCQAVRDIAVSTEAEGSVSYAAHFSLPRDGHNARGFGGKVYGVATFVRADGVTSDASVRKPDWDLEGRVLIHEFGGRSTVVFNVYAVNGTEKAYREPMTGLVSGTRHDRKRAFHAELAAECRGYEEKGWWVIVAGDMNVARGPEDGWPGRRMGEQHVRNRADFERHFMNGENGLRMVDSFRELHVGERKYSYRSRGAEWGVSADRVDMVLVSRSVLGSGSEQVRDGDAKTGGRLIEADVVDDELNRGPSDHMPLYATIDLSTHRMEVHEDGILEDGWKR